MTRSQPGHSAHYDNNIYMNADPTAHADDPLFGRVGVLGN
jgi:hypothetical protein